LMKIVLKRRWLQHRNLIKTFLKGRWLQQRTRRRARLSHLVKKATKYLRSVSSSEGSWQHFVSAQRNHIETMKYVTRTRGLTVEMLQDFVTTNIYNQRLWKLLLTLRLLMSYIYGAPCKAKNFIVVYTWTYVWLRWKLSLSICCTVFQHWINAESFPVSQLCVNTLPATKITLITNGI
jgi:hypothetical protein